MVEPFAREYGDVMLKVGAVVIPNSPNVEERLS